MEHYYLYAQPAAQVRGFHNRPFPCVDDSFERWGVTLPINQDSRLGNMIDAEQAAALCEALTGLDASDVRRAGNRECIYIGGGRVERER